MSWDWEKLKEQQQQRKPMDFTPNLDEWAKTLKKLKIPGGPLLILLVVVAIFGMTVFYTVGVDEVGVVQRFGRYVRTAQPGLNFKLPIGIEKVTKVKVRHIFKEEFGFRTMRTGAGSPILSESESDVSLMLTGDLNVGLVPWIVQYRIKEPYNFLFKVKEVGRLLSDMSEAAMRLVVGDRSINEVITKREEIADEAKILLQSELDVAESGIEVVTIEMKRTNVPVAVQPSFNEVNQAVQEKERMVYNAREEYNKAIPAARGEAEKTIRSAEGYAFDRVNRAKGDSARFVSIYEEYSKAKDVTKRRMYLEALKELLPKLGPKYIIDADQKNVLPLVNIAKGAEK